MSLYKLCNPNASSSKKSRLLDLFAEYGSISIARMCSKTGIYAVTASIRDDVLPFDPDKESKQTLINWLTYRGAQVDRNDLVASVKRDFAQSTLPLFKDYISFDPKKVSLAFLQQWLACHNLTASVHPRRWWEEKAELLVKAKRKAKRQDVPVTEESLEKAIKEMQTFDQLYNLQTEVLLEFDQKVLNKMSLVQYRRLEQAFMDVFFKKKSKPTKLVPKAETVDQSSFLESKELLPVLARFVDKNSNLSMLGMLIFAALMQMGIVFNNKPVEKDSEDTASKQEKVFANIKEYFVKKGKEDAYDVLAKEGVNEFAQKYNVNFLSPGQVTRMVFDLIIRGKSGQIVDKLGSKILEEYVPGKENKGLAARTARGILIKQLEGVLKLSLIHI